MIIQLIKTHVFREGAGFTAKSLLFSPVAEIFLFYKINQASLK